MEQKQTHTHTHIVYTDSICGFVHLDFRSSKTVFKSNPNVKSYFLALNSATRISKKKKKKKWFKCELKAVYVNEYLQTNQYSGCFHFLQTSVLLAHVPPPVGTLTQE